MQIQTAMQKLHEAYKKGNPSLGCVSRATILDYVMRSKGLNSKKRLFFFADKEGRKEIGNHCVVIVDEKVYDPNIEATQNPTTIQQYEEMKTQSHKDLILVWEDWTQNHDMNNQVDFSWNYLSRFDDEFQTEVKALMKEDYEEFLKLHPPSKEVKPNLVE